MPRKKKLEIVETLTKVAEEGVELKMKPTKETKREKKQTRQKPFLIEKGKADSTLILCEKPQAAMKISAALSDGKDRKLSDNGVPFYEFEHNGKKFIVGCAVGHLFGIGQKEGTRGTFPAFDVVWRPNYESKGAAFTKKYYDLLAKLSKRSNEFIIATDYDNEGEVIGWNVLRFLAKQQNAKRMKFSSLTKDELQDAFKNASPHLNWGQAIAGETRHYIDWFYGINLSRGLMKALAKTGKFRILSIGRVQGPALALVVDRELEIKNFKPVPFWQIFLLIQDLNKNKVEVKFPADIFKESDLLKFKHLKGKKAQARTEIKEEQIPAPTPFDLTTLQTEAYGHLGITPTQTLQIAQKLYLAGLISYPRTSSQQYPEAIGYDKIMKSLSKQTQLTKYAVNKKPTEGKKTDPAHPAIYPTGEVKKDLEGREGKLYELIVKRFISCFCAPAIVDTKNLKVEIDSLVFTANGLMIKEKNWMNVYPSRTKENKIPTINGEVEIKEIRIEEKETQPPKRYSQASLIKELEKRNLGTKCLTGDTKSIINNQSVSMDSLFEKGKPYSNEKDTEIRKIIGKTLSLTKEDKIQITNPKLISRRHLKDNEKILEIETDFSKIKLTDEHKVYILRNNKIYDMPAKNLEIKDNLISLSKDFEEGEILININSLKEKTKIVSDNILHKFSGKSSKGIKLSHFPIKWTTSLAWVLGYYYGDGNYSNPKYNGSHQVSFTTTEQKALILLKENIKNIFGNEPYCYDLKGKYKVDCNSFMSSTLLKIFPEIEGKRQMEIPDKFIGAFLRGFFDADGNVHLRPKGRTKIKGNECNSFDTPRVKITLAKEELIKWVSKLLFKLNIKNKISKSSALCNGKRFDCWTILIGGRDKVEKFTYEVGFDSYKEKILYSGLKCDSWKYDVLKNSTKIYLLLNKGEKSVEEINKEISMDKYKIKVACRKLKKDGLVKRKRYGNGRNQKWKYYIPSVNKKFMDYCIKFRYKKINENIYEIPIRKINKIDYSGFVYDISVDKNCPNFILEGNILVHNSTRANIIDTLTSRGYIEGSSIEATSLGIRMISTLKKYSPIIIDENMTKEMDEEMEKMTEHPEDKSNLESTEEKILKTAKTAITKIAGDITKNMEKIGADLAEANEEVREAERESNMLTECPVCHKGKLRILYGRAYKRYFIACSNYPECKNKYSLPPYGLMKPCIKSKKAQEEEMQGEENEDKKEKLHKKEKEEIENEQRTDLELCPECSFPLMLAIQKGKRPWKFCFNPLCPSRKRQEEYRKEHPKKRSEKQEEEDKERLKVAQKEEE